MTNLFKSLLAAAAIAAGQPALAAINDATRGDPSELFVAVYDAAAGKSYYQDLGRSMVQFLQSPGGSFDLAGDAAYAPFVGKPGLVFNVAAFYPLKTDLSNLSNWGYMLTSADGAGIFRPNFVAIDAVRQKIQVYVFDLNPVPYDGTPDQAALNLSGVYGPANGGYFDGDDWGINLGGQLAGSTAGATDVPLDFYFVNNQIGDDSGGRVSKLGSWTLSSAGVLSFASSGGNTGNTPPIANAGADQAVTVGAVVTLDGSGSSDPDSAPSPLSYAWTQLGGPGVSLSAGNVVNPSFTPSIPGSYEFQLTVSDGAASVGDSVLITVNDAPLPTGPGVTFDAPKTWTAGQKQRIAWTFREIPGKRKATIKFAKNGVKFNKLVRTLAIKKGAVNWKPKKSWVTTNGALQICVRPAKKQPKVCDTLSIVVDPKP